MVFKVTEMQSSLGRTGAAKASHYFLRVNSPIGFLDGIRAETAELPGRSIQTSNVRYFGVTKRVGYDVTYPDLNMTILLSEDLREKVYLTKWQDRIIGAHARPGAGLYDYRIGYYDDYVGTVEVFQYSTTGTMTYKMKLKEAYPVLINTLSSNWASEDFHRLSVSFVYKEWIEN